MTGERTAEIWIDGTRFLVALNGTRTAAELLDALPLRGDGAFWGDEIYFDVGVDLPGESERAEVEIGDVAYWRPGTALCLFFGRTPASTTDEPRAASPVTVIGRLVDDPARLKTVRNLSGVEVRRPTRV